MDSLGFSGPVAEALSNVFKARNGLFIQSNCMNWHLAIADPRMLSLGDAEAPGQCCTGAVAPTTQGHRTHHPAQAGSSEGLCSHPGVRHIGQGGWEKPTSHQQRLAPGGKGKTAPSRVVSLELPVSASALGSQLSHFIRRLLLPGGEEMGVPPPRQPPASAAVVPDIPLAWQPAVLFAATKQSPERAVPPPSPDLACPEQAAQSASQIPGTTTAPGGLCGCCLITLSGGEKKKIKSSFQIGRQRC